MNERQVCVVVNLGCMTVTLGWKKLNENVITDYLIKGSLTYLYEGEVGEY